MFLSGYVFILIFAFAGLLFFGFVLFIFQNIGQFDSAKSPIIKEPSDSVPRIALMDCLTSRNVKNLELDVVENGTSEPIEILRFTHRDLEYQLATSMRTKEPEVKLTSELVVSGSLGKICVYPTTSVHYVIDTKNHFWCEEQCLAKMVELMDSKELPDLLSKDPL